MSSWKIAPKQVQKVLTGLDPDLKTLSGALATEKLAAIPEGLTSGAPITAKVPAAMQYLLADQKEELATIVNHIGAGIQGVVNATVAYARGQEEQAAAFQREMFKSAGSGDLSYFAKHGYKG